MEIRGREEPNQSIRKRFFIFKTASEIENFRGAYDIPQNLRVVTFKASSNGFGHPAEFTLASSDPQNVQMNLVVYAVVVTVICIHIVSVINIYKMLLNSGYFALQTAFTSFSGAIPAIRITSSSL